MVELIYIGADANVTANAEVPFNRAIGCGCNERYESNTNTLTLLKPGKYMVTATANIAIPTGGTVGDISVALTSNGSVIAGTTATVTPAAVEEFQNVATQTVLTVYPCGNKTVGLRAITDLDINNQNLIAVRIGGCYA